MAVSIVEPPPTATIASKSCLRARTRSRRETTRRSARRARGRTARTTRRSPRATRAPSAPAAARAEHRIGQHEHAPDAQVGEVHAHFARHAGAEADADTAISKCAVIHRGRVSFPQISAVRCQACRGLHFTESSRDAGRGAPPSRHGRASETPSGLAPNRPDLWKTNPSPC